MARPNPGTGPQPALPEFVSDEAKLTVIDTNSRAFLAHACAARDHETRAARLRAERDSLLRQIKDLQERVEKLGFEASQEEHRAGQEHVTAKAYAQILKLLEAPLPPIPPPPDQPPPGAQVWPDPRETQPIENAARAALGSTPPPQTGAFMPPPVQEDPLQKKVNDLMADHPDDRDADNPVWGGVKREGGAQ